LKKLYFIFVFSLLLFILIGCGQGQDSENSRPIISLEKTIYNKKLELKEDEYHYQKHEFTQNFIIYFDIENLTSNGFEIFVFDEANFKKYKDQKQTSGHSINVPGMYENKESITIEQGVYYIVIDNTDYGSVVPPMNFSDDIVITQLKISYKY